MPALLSLVALLLLTALVWWRVLNRSSGDTTHPSAKSACPSASASATPAARVLPAPASVTVQILNSTTRHGIAGGARTALVTDGFKAPAQAGNDTHYLNKIKTTAQLRFGPAGRQGATLLGYYLPGSTPVQTTSKNATVVVSLGKAYRGVASNAAVTAALKKAGLSTVTPARPTASC
ncbi:LytR C-terminal domain-containing protein [uncultured Jatrophihabitans sp.]|uniref:LytR C-terminal domain-containing protein n=1 Tax=uncultured Jatrophihabitans sp. TaxID=1610747 RepID=UPI0035C954DF